MNKFKAGDKVVCVNDWNGIGISKGEEYTISFIVDDEVGLREVAGFYYTRFFELIDDKPFTQEDLEVGMLVEYKHGDIFNINSEPSARIARKAENVVAIYKPTEIGFERVWTKPEPKLYKLACPLSGLQLYINQLKDYEWEIFGTKFTQEEIENLPNQELINVLIKKGVVE